ncbi:MAG TPA: MBL fold metallo-hydrolase [Acidimicrobiales bacterium]|nr:MBL fold metallo-hydrolase [Acidimicrobiales bacterium]
MTELAPAPSPTPRPPKQEQLPASEEIAEVGVNVLRLQLPIEMPGLGHVNCYALIDDRGAALVDPGLPGPASWRDLTGRLALAGLKLSDVHTVIATHSHPDHFGGAGQLAAEVGADVVVHAAFARWLTADPTAGPDLVDLDGVDLEDYPHVSPFEEGTPWGTVWLRPAGVGEPTSWIHPQPTTWVRNDEVLRLAGRDWFVLHTPGHTLDHICLHDPEEGILLSGDHVLPTITPHIAGLGAGRDPLTAFKDSLERISQVGDVKVVLPAHGQPFSDLAGRCAAIEAHHAERLGHLQDISQEIGPATVIQLSQKLFRPQVWGGMAESETYAHLEHLRVLGLAERRGEGASMIYELAARTP